MKNAGSQGVENMGSPFLTNKHLPAFRFATKRSASNFFFFFGECPPTETRLITLPQTLVHQPGLSTNTIQNITTLIAQSINQSINQSIGRVGVSKKFSKQFIWAFFAFAKTNFLRYPVLPLSPPPLKNNGHFLSEAIKHAAWIRCDNAT